MKPTREKIIKCFVNKGVDYEIIDIDKSVPNHENDTLFVIKGNNLLYFTDFKLVYHTEYTTYYDVKGDLFFVTPTGTLSGDFILSVDIAINPEDFEDMFIVRCEDFMGCYDEIDDMIMSPNTDHFKNTEIDML